MRTISGSSSTLNTGLTAYWKLDEASGTRVDSGSNGQNLTDNNTVTSNTGIISNAGQFVAINSEYLSRADSSVLSCGDIDVTITAWVYLDDTAAERTLVSKYETSAQREYLLRYNNSTARFECVYYGTTSATATASSFGAPSTSTWYFICTSHDSINNEVTISINGGTVDTTSHTGGINDSSAPFAIGARGSAAVFANGRIDEVGFWKKELSTAEIAELYNAGAGKTCCPF